MRHGNPSTGCHYIKNTQFYTFNSWSSASPNQQSHKFTLFEQEMTEYYRNRQGKEAIKTRIRYLMAQVKAAGNNKAKKEVFSSQLMNLMVYNLPLVNS